MFLIFKAVIIFFCWYTKGVDPVRIGGAQNVWDFQCYWQVQTLVKLCNWNLDYNRNTEKLLWLEPESYVIPLKIMFFLCSMKFTHFPILNIYLCIFCNVCEWNKKQCFPKRQNCPLLLSFFLQEMISKLIFRKLTKFQ